jgi:hypothetical protein
MTNKERYHILCETRSDLHLFMQAWWLDAVTAPYHHEWDVLLYEEDGKIVGAMPYVLMQKWGFNIIFPPFYTKHSGIWIDASQNSKAYKRYSFEKRVMDNLITQLEGLKLSHYSQTFHYSFTDWQPFYWRGFRQTTRYTYVLKNIADIDSIYNNIQPRCKDKIKKGTREMSVDFKLSPEEFYDFHRKSLADKNEKIAYSKAFLQSVFETASKRKQGAILAVRNKDNELLSAIFFMWDKNSAYYLIPARKVTGGSNNAAAFMLWETIKYLQDKTENFDFEGSMIEGVAKLNQQFGAEQLPYSFIEKSYSKLFSFLMKLKNTF